MRGKGLPFQSLTTVHLKSWPAPYASAALLLFLVVLGYANSLTAPFVFDDFHAIVQNQDIRNWDRFLHSSWWNRPRALVDFTFALQWHFHENRVLPYHVVNMVVHGLNAVMAYCLSLALFQHAQNHSTHGAWKPNPQRAAFFSAALFAVHPLQTQAVTYIVQRYTSMSAFFYFGALLCYLRFRKTTRSGYAFASCALGLAAFLCKQNALTLPMTIFVIEWLLLKDGASFRRIAARLVLPAIMLLALVFWNLGLFSGSWSMGQVLSDVDRITRETPLVSRTSYFWTQLRVLCLYLLMLLAPVRQSVDHGYPIVHSFLVGWTSVAALVLLTLTAAAWTQRRRRPMLSLGFFWFLSTLSLESSIFPIKDALVEHRLYMPILGWGWIFAWGLERLGLIHRRVGLSLTVIVLGLLLAGTVHRNQVWNDPIRLWREATERNPSHYRPANNLGRLLLDAGRSDEAETFLLLAMALNPLRPNVHFNLGLLYGGREQWDLAVQAFRSAILLDPAKAGFHYNLGLALHRMGRLSEAQMAYEAAFVLDPGMEEAALNLAATYFQKGDPAGARHVLEEAMAHNAVSFRLPYFLSVVCQALGANEAALRAVNLALERNAEDRQALFQKALVLASSGALGEALAIAEALQSRYPEDERIAILLDKILSLLGEPKPVRP